MNNNSWGVSFASISWFDDSYTSGAKEHAIQQELGLFNSAEIGAALFKNDYWNFHRKDRNGSPQYHIREEQ